MLVITDAGVVVAVTDGDFIVDNNTVAEITAKKWYTVEITFNFDNDKFSVKLSDEQNVLAEVKNISLASNLKAGIHSFGVLYNTAASKAAKYTMYFDNMKFEVPSVHVNEFASDLAKLDFAEESEGYAVVTDAIGISAEATQSYYTYEKFGKYPDKIKAEASIKRNEVGETALYFGDAKIASLGQDGLVSTDSSEALSTDSDWTKVTLYMDFAAGKYDVLMDGEEVAADADIPAGITTPEEFKIGVENGGTLLVDYMKVSALAPYGSNKITGYLDENGAFRYGYVVNNPDSEELRYNIIKVKLDRDGIFKEVETVTSNTVATSTMEIHTIEPDFSINSNYYRYFMLDANTLEPLN